MRRFLLWYSEYYHVDLAADFSPTRREAQELRAKYNINVSGGMAGGAEASQREDTAVIGAEVAIPSLGREMAPHRLDSSASAGQLGRARVRGGAGWRRPHKLLSYRVRCR